ncbi:hypothetical protein IC235_13940 [Hymenobacter sp. BT664]|uniref:Lipoprotein n=1 Tax=Hymenobacter montanus TaxID=2771359 RepID=A0A927BFA0_9BACT|nr:hypothetical protein [Hymenobacter montanus]MBD2768989.1 hypothetical protein [Hymenobacter montanus]
MPAFPRRLLLLAGLATSGCARPHYFQADARIGPGSTAALPATTDTVRVAAGRHYNQHSGFYCFFMGRHYRRVWAAPATVPVLRLATAAPGGLEPGRPGGGYQSISMTLTGAQGREYALRALDKDPRRTVPKVLRATFLLNAVRDATSAGMPYGALTVPPLAQAAGVPHSRPRLVYVRDDETGLGAMSERFRGKVALLEEKYAVLASRTPDLAGATGFVDSEGMLQNVYAHPCYALDQLAFLRARLLDVWLGDWDRHEGQWQWAAFPEAAGRVQYRPIPKDRDQVYFKLDDGLVPWLLTRLAPQFQTFKAHYGNVAGLVKQARFIDHRGLSQLTRADFQRLAADLQRRLPDSLIDQALRRLPPAVFALEGPHLAAALKARREALPQAADAFYLTLAHSPVLGGTAEPERFVVHRYPDSTTVQVFSATLAHLRPGGDSLRFRRTYLTPETRRLTLEGLGGDDVFEVITTGAGRPIRLRLFGGPGHDQLRLQGSPQRLALFDDAADMRADAGPRPQLPPKRHRAYDRLNDD